MFKTDGKKGGDIKMAREKCNTVYNEGFITELEHMCPKKESSMTHRREKKAVILILCTLSAVIASVGVAIAGFSTAVANKH